MYFGPQPSAADEGGGGGATTASKEAVRQLVKDRLLDAGAWRAQLLALYDALMMRRARHLLATAPQ